PRHVEAAALRGMWRASALLAGNVPAEGDLQPADEMGILPAVPLPLLDVRLDVAGPLARVAIRVEANKFEIAVMVKTFPISNSKPPAPARRAEADGTGCRHLNPSSGLLRRSSPSFRTPTPRRVEAAAVAGHVEEG